jgi:ABC-type antimicrobial peptide transport system ATPase subunit
VTHVLASLELIPAGSACWSTRRQTWTSAAKQKTRATLSLAQQLMPDVVVAHKANAMNKLELANRIDVVRYALLRGWLQET